MVFSNDNVDLKDHKKKFFFLKVPTALEKLFWGLDRVSEVYDPSWWEDGLKTSNQAEVTLSIQRCIKILLF